MDRRRFLQSSVTLAGGAFAGLPRSAIASPFAQQPRWADAIMIDALAPDAPGFDARLAINGGLTGAIVDMAMYPRNYTNAQRALDAWDAAFRERRELLRVLRAADLRTAHETRRLGVVLACQDAQILDASTFSVNRQNLTNLAAFHERGLRVLQLTHNERNAVGDSFREKADAGLSRLGEAVVAEMNTLGMLIDLSHCGRRTTLEAIALSNRPCAITHAGCRALFDTARNKTDEEIRAVAERGGFFGVFNMSLWLTLDREPTVDHVVAHIAHAINIAGEDHVGLGSDGPVTHSTTPPALELEGMRGYAQRNLGLPGAERIPDHVHVQALNSPSRLTVLADALSRKGYREAAIEKIIGGNILRVLQETIG